MASEVSARQRLSVPEAVLDAGDLGDDAEVLISEHVLVRDGGEIAFFHEAFFDYAFARQWVAKADSLVDFLTSDEQELVRRAQVHQILHYLRQIDPNRFVTEVRALLDSSDVRYHIKDLVLAVVGGLTDPSSAEATVMLEVANGHPTLSDRVWQRSRTRAWYLRLDADGIIAGRLGSSDEALQQQALTLMGTAARHVPDAGNPVATRHGSSMKSEWSTSPPQSEAAAVSPARTPTG